MSADDRDGVNEGASPQTPSFDVHQLEYYRKQDTRNTLIARAILLGLIFGGLAANIVMSQRNYETMLVNIDQVRLAQAQLAETTDAGLASLQDRIQAVEAAVRAEQTAPTDAVADAGQ